MHAQFAHRSSFQFTMAELLEFSIFEPIERHREYVPHPMLDRCKMACKKFVIFAVDRVWPFSLVSFLFLHLLTNSKSQGIKALTTKIKTLSNELTLWKNLSVKNCKELYDKGLTKGSNWRALPHIMLCGSQGYM